MKVRLPPLSGIDQRINGNTIKHLIFPGFSVDAEGKEYNKPPVHGFLLTLGDKTTPVLVITKGAQPPEEFDYVLRAKGNSINQEDAVDLSSGKWERHPYIAKIPKESVDFARYLRKVTSSWRKSFTFVKEDPATGTKGLRSPQIGAIYATLAHWTISNKPATITLPTGTGKTETMLSVLILNQCSKLLVVVPTDALRTQISEKFLTLGILKEIGAVAGNALYPVVGILKHKPRTIEEVDDIFSKCNVVVTTIQIAGQCNEDIQTRMVYHFPFLFIDEAHHIGAQTWKAFKEKFASRHILQFTATPFRNDGIRVDGKPIYTFPLKQALDEGYFKPIQYKPIVEFDPNTFDKAIAEQAVQQLREDLAQGYDHILMARVDSVQRAQDVFSVYQKYPEFNPVQIHTGIKSAKEQAEIRRKIITKEARIVICVDMLGEGFDLPELKIAAFHDIRKSLAITLQLVGRFIRARNDLGNPTVVVNLGGEISVPDELKKLYAQDADWNVLLPQSSEKVTQEQVDFWEFIEGFKDFPPELPLQNFRPAMSTVIYKTTCDSWHPENWLEGIEAANSLEHKHAGINYDTDTLVIVTARRVPIDWVQIKDIYNWDWELYVLSWDREQNLLFINSSNNSGYYQKLAEAVAGDVLLLRGVNIFRCLAGINRLKLQNVGLIEELGRLIRYTMSAGSDVESGLSEAQKRAAKKANIFGVGFEEGEKSSIGCSYKGRIWSRKVTNVEALSKWCKVVGQKVLDESIDPNEILKGTLVSVEVPERPTKMPVSIEWPEVMYTEPEAIFEFFIEGKQILLKDAELRLIDPAEEGDIRFELASEDVCAEMVLAVFEQKGKKDFHFSVTDGKKVSLKVRSSISDIETFFYEQNPKVWFADGSSLEGNSYTELKHKYPLYPVEKIQAWDWEGIDIRKESQGISKEENSIQRLVIRALMKGDYDVIYDDDGAGESADIVTIKERAGEIAIEFFHCKFSKEDEPGGRIDDLYTVCGQAQKSIHWREKPEDLFRHLIRREPKRRGGKQTTRFEMGSREILHTLQMKLRSFPICLSIYIVQPGLSKDKVTPGQLELLSVTENYLMETYKLPFGIIANH